MARVAEKPCYPRVDAHPTEQVVASRLDLPRSDRQAWGLAIKHGVRLRLVPCFCRLIIL